MDLARGRAITSPVLSSSVMYVCIWRGKEFELELELELHTNGSMEYIVGNPPSTNGGDEVSVGFNLLH